MCVVATIALASANVSDAQVVRSASDGFQIKIVKTTQLDPAAAYACLVDDISQWWDADHTYSGKSENVSMDLERQCLYERLPDGGFVRHLEIVYCQPGKMLRLTGGLGPLQELGCTGAMTFRFVPKGDGAELEMTYNVVASKDQQLDKIAPAVAQVLEGQLDRWREFSDRTTGGPSDGKS